jgi:hypothetical protein
MIGGIQSSYRQVQQQQQQEHLVAVLRQQQQVKQACPLAHEQQWKLNWQQAAMSRH